MMKAAQHEASPAALSRKAPKAQGLLLVEHKGVLRRHLPEAHDTDSAHPCDGRAKPATEIWELAKSAENKNNNRVRLGPIPCTEL
jgi:hypothetical protein